MLTLRMFTQLLVFYWWLYRNRRIHCKLANVKRGILLVIVQKPQILYKLDKVKRNTWQRWLNTQPQSCSEQLPPVRRHTCWDNETVTSPPVGVDVNCTLNTMFHSTESCFLIGLPPKPNFNLSLEAGTQFSNKPTNFEMRRGQARGQPIERGGSFFIKTWTFLK